ncbi:MAG: hypothetical protein KJN71_09485 [Acidimicrobiia bacterium]|nr:hypothetical protein [Acidimicrobiia bacterium]
MLTFPYDRLDEFEVSPRVTLHRGDPVKVEGIRGKFTFKGLQVPHDKRRKLEVDVFEKRTGATRTFFADRIRKGRA